MSNIKRQHAILLESDNFKIEIVVDFKDDKFGITLFDTYSKKAYLHLADDTTEELIELLQAGLKELKNEQA